MPLQSLRKLCLVSILLVTSTPVSLAATFVILASGDGNVTITPTVSQTVRANQTATYTVIAKTGYTISMDVGGSCPVGSWSSNAYSYTTGPIVASCTISFSAKLNPFNQPLTNDYIDTNTGTKWE